MLATMLWAGMSLFCHNVSLCGLSVRRLYYGTMGRPVEVTGVGVYGI